MSFLPSYLNSQAQAFKSPMFGNQWPPSGQDSNYFVQNGPGQTPQPLMGIPSPGVPGHNFRGPSQRWQNHRQGSRFKGRDKPYKKQKARRMSFESVEKIKSLYNCDTCDKPFKTEEAFSIHVSQHETCGKEGCTFTAHPKIVAKHVSMQHKSGLFKRIGKLYSEVEIKKWVEERKRCYPTMKAVEQKKQLQAAQEERGERIQKDKSCFNKSFPNGKHKRNRSMKRNFEKRDFNRNRNKQMRMKAQEKEVIATNVEEEKKIELRGNLPSFCGFSSVEPESPEVVKSQPLVEPEPTDDSYTDDEWDATTFSQQKNVAVKQVLNSSLNMLVSCYGSDNDSETEEFDECKNSVKSQTTQSNYKADIPAKLERVEEVANMPNDDDSNSLPVEMETKRVIEAVCPEEISSEKSDNNKRRRRHDGQKHRKMMKTNQQQRNMPQRSVRPPTLLEKLLSTEIRHERNVLLQCIRFVVQKNFFQFNNQKNDSL